MCDAKSVQDFALQILFDFSDFYGQKHGHLHYYISCLLPGRGHDKSASLNILNVRKKSIYYHLRHQRADTRLTWVRINDL